MYMYMYALKNCIMVSLTLATCNAAMHIQRNNYAECQLVTVVQTYNIATGTVCIDSA